MKKFFIIILVILLSILTYFLIAKNIKIGNWQSSSISDIKTASSNLSQQIDTAKQLNNQEYPASISNLEEAGKKLKIAKEKYEAKKNYVDENVELGVVNIKEYKIERLWTVLGNYAKDKNLDLKLDVLDTATQGSYDLNITIVGDYIGITDFIYAIEKDDTLGFKILNFKLVPRTSSATTTAESEDGKQQIATTTVVDANELTATFKIEGVGIQFN